MADDVGVERVHPRFCAGCRLDFGQTAEVIDMRMRDDDPRDVGRLTAELTDGLDDANAITWHPTVHQRQLGPDLE
jgi:hypothetical protein